MDYNSTTQSLQALVNQLTTYAGVMIGIRAMFGALVLFLFSKSVMVLCDIAINTQKIETGEDYKLVKIIADVMVIISYLVFAGGALVIIKSL